MEFTQKEIETLRQIILDYDSYCDLLVDNAQHLLEDDDFSRLDEMLYTAMLILGEK